MDPWRISARSTAEDDSTVDFAFQCSRAECRRVFVAGYRLGLDGEFDLESVAAAHDTASGSALDRSALDQG